MDRDESQGRVVFDLHILRCYLNTNGQYPNEYFEGSQVFVVVSSVGNVAQLAVQLMLANLSDQETVAKIGDIFHPALEAVVGPPSKVDLKSSRWLGEEPSIMTACEILQVSDLQHVRKYSIILFNSPVAKKGRDDFVNFFADWIHKRKFGNVVVLTSSSASERNDAQLSGNPFRFLATESAPEELLTNFKKLNIKAIENREFPAPAVIDGEIISEKEAAVVHLPGSGITQSLYYKCRDSRIPFLAFVMFASEGDCTPEAMTFFRTLEKLFDVGKQGDDCESETSLTIPYSWTQIGENPVWMF